MPLFDKKKAQVDATKRWVGDVRFALELDLSRHSLSGVKVGSSIDGLMRMGPAEDAGAATDEVYRWLSRGVEVSADAAFVNRIRILWENSEGFRPFPGQVSYQSQMVSIDSIITESALIDLIGPPYWRDEDEEETLLFYEFGRFEWQIEFTKRGRLSQWTIVSPPLMADSEQRTSYGVTRAWPPVTPGRIRPRGADAILKRTS